ncbi:MAG: Crp/Fnr family transcriptional regulator [Gammaproteobacteria bacterium]|nr:MAG: Crp/Fnr family transcriptional regulator [Gammaproteobacteria bacterium]
MSNRILDPTADLRKLSWLNVLDPIGWAELQAATQLRSYGPGEVIFLEGDPPEAFYLVHQGWVKAIKLSPEGREQILDFLGPGQPINIAPVFAEQPNPATLVAQEACELWVIQQSILLSLLDRYPAMARLVIRALAGRLLHTISMIEDLSLRSVTARLAKLLLVQLADSEQTAISRHRWATQTEIAARLGTVPDVVNRAIRDLAREGLIQVDRRQIVILDRAGLVAKAQFWQP